MEYSAIAINPTHKHFDHMLQMTGKFIVRQSLVYLMKFILGMRIEVNTTQPEGSRIKSIDILCEECSPVQYAPIDINKSYRVIANNFLSGGGDGHTIISDNKQNYV